MLKDGRKSFRQISRETKLSTPTVKSRFNRLINSGVIKSISPIVDFDIVSYNVKDRDHKSKHVYQFSNNIINATRQSINDRKRYSDLRHAIRVSVDLNCNYCNTPLLGKMYTFKFANLEQFFCCKECRLAYEKRYAARIRAIREKYHNHNRHK